MMTKIDKIKFMLEENIFPIFNTDETYIDTNNGILNDELLERKKKSFLKDSLVYTIDELIKVKQSYPQDNLSKVTFDTEFFILKKDDFLKIVKLIDELDETTCKCNG